MPTDSLVPVLPTHTHLVLIAWRTKLQQWRKGEERIARPMRSNKTAGSLLKQLLEGF